MTRELNCTSHDAGVLPDKTCLKTLNLQILPLQVISTVHGNDTTPSAGLNLQATPTAADMPRKSEDKAAERLSLSRVGPAGSTGPPSTTGCGTTTTGKTPNASWAGNCRGPTLHSPAAADSAPETKPAPDLHIETTWAALDAPRDGEGGNGELSTTRPAARPSAETPADTKSASHLHIETTSADTAAPWAGEGKTGERSTTPPAGAAGAQAVADTKSASGLRIETTWVAGCASLDEGARGAKRSTTPPAAAGAAGAAATADAAVTAADTKSASGLRIETMWVAGCASLGGGAGGGKRSATHPAAASAAPAPAATAAHTKDKKPEPGLRIETTWTAGGAPLPAEDRLRDRGGEGSTTPRNAAVGAESSDGTMSVPDLDNRTTWTVAEAPRTGEGRSSLRGAAVFDAALSNAARTCPPLSVATTSARANAANATIVAPAARGRPCKKGRDKGFALVPTTSPTETKTLICHWRDISAFNALSSLLICRRGMGAFDEDATVTQEARRYFEHLDDLTRNINAGSGQPRKMKVLVLRIACRNKRVL